jgi:hypothetical protein
MNSIQLFLAGFLDLAFVLALPLVSTLGRPLVPPSRIASMSASRYMPAEPIYWKGFIPFLIKRVLTAEEEIPKRWVISNTVIPSIYINDSLKNYSDQVEKAKMQQHKGILLYNRIAKKRKICKFLNFFCQTLDYPMRRGV